MGSSQSNTRKLSVENDNAIQVSQEAIERIKSQLSTQIAEEPQPAPPPVQQYIPPPEYYDNAKQKERIAEEVYWARRIENLKRAHEKINASMDQEYKKTLKEAEELFSAVDKETITAPIPPCQSEKAKVLECYTANPNTTLMCSVLVNQFNDCVCKSRIAALSAS